MRMLRAIGGLLAAAFLACAPAGAQTLTWDGSGLPDGNYSVRIDATDSGGNVYVAGFNGDSGNKAYLRKYDSSGTLLWSRATTPGGYNAVTAFGVNTFETSRRMRV